MPLNRRQFIGAAAGIAATAAVPSAAAATSRASALAALPNPRSSGLDHIVFLCMENRSFDHFLGWLPGADGKQAGLRYKDDKGVSHSTHHLTTRQGCGFNDPDHSYEGGRTQLDGGKMDGFRKGDNDDFALGYYTEADLPFYKRLLPEATTFDRYFCSILGPTFPNRFYTHSAYTDRLTNVSRSTALPTIYNRLAAAGVSHKYYFSDLPFLALYGQQYLPISTKIENFYLDAAAGRLPSYSYLDPAFLGEDQGGSNDDHPHADIHRGQALVSQVVAALVNSPQWSRTALVITYDEWGGFFEHVVPPHLPDDHNRAFGGARDHTQAGFRVPTIVLSPFARRGYVEHAVYDHTSLLKLLEWRFGLPPLTRRDAAARNLAEALDFTNPRTTKPVLPVVVDPGPHICGTPGEPTTSSTASTAGLVAGGRPMGLEDPFWRELADSSLMKGWDAVR